MANYTTLNDNNFEQEVLKSDKPVLIDLWAEWCAPCKMIEPIIDEISVEINDKVKICKLDVDGNPQVSMNYGIRAIPTLLIFKDGKAVDQIVGVVPKKVILEKLSKFIND
jgi:thioredoxin 1